jgi:hypothetical protein
MFIFNTKLLNVGLLPQRRGLNQDRSLYLYSLQDHLRIGMGGLDHLVLADAENTNSFHLLPSSHRGIEH